MKLRWKLTLGLVTVGVIAAVVLSRRESLEERALEQTRRDLRAHGFKIDLAEFDFSTSDELRARATALTNTSSYSVPRTHEDFARRSLLLQIKPELMETIGRDSAVTVWKQETWAADAGAATYVRLAGLSNDLWLAVRESSKDNRDILDKACAAALSGPIRFHLNATQGNGMLLPHLATLRTLNQTLGGCVVLELHDGNQTAAWTNLMAATRLVTAWEPEPAEVSLLVRDACATLVFNIIWQALQSDGWSDEQLAQLQHEWESVDYFQSLPETAAFARASAARSCQDERQQPLGSLTLTARDLFRSPRQSWANLVYHYRRLQYRRHGSFEDEKDLLLHYRDHEMQLRQALLTHTWSEMRKLPGVINNAPSRSKHTFSSTIMMLNSRQMILNIQGQGQGLLARTAAAEARRRLIITAISLERFRGRHGAYPKSLTRLLPEWLKDPPVDFMDGQPLRYRLTDDGHFVLYSVGLDCTDNDGTMPARRRGKSSYDPSERAFQPDTDLVWPRPASAAEAQAQAEAEKRQEDAELQAALDREAEHERQREISRQATVRKLLAQAKAGRNSSPAAGSEPGERTYNGNPLSKLLQNEMFLGSTQRPLEELLTLHQLHTGEEPDIATFELPILYEVVTNIGGLRLLVDAAPDESDGFGGELQECDRATNGNCLLIWNTTYDPPGQHAIQAQLNYTDRTKGRDNREVRGPVKPFFSSNICQFFAGHSMFDDRGATLYAKLPESNGVYTIELKSPAGDLIKTITGTTSNGVINVEWNLKDENGNTYTNNSFETIYHVTLPDAALSQEQKGH